MWPFRRLRRKTNLGQSGEQLARKFLRRKRWKILATNYRCPSGEIDLIALDGVTGRQLGADTIVFIEVKTRTDDHYVSPESAVNAAKRRRIRKSAAYYLAHHNAAGFNIRHDIISIVAAEGEKPRIKHIPRAF